MRGSIVSRGLTPGSRSPLRTTTRSPDRRGSSRGLTCVSASTRLPSAGDGEGGGVTEANLTKQIEHVVNDLTKEFGEAVGLDKVREEVMSVYGRLAQAPIRQFVPALTRRIAREELLRKAM
jgi:hypothetical protein